jgi:hypothetical protein
MRLLALCALCLPAVALAGDPPPAPDCATLTGDAKGTCELNLQLTTAKAELVALGDCAAAAADAKATCDAKKVELDKKIADLTAKLEPPKDVKGGKATRSNTNRMEAEAEDE